MIAWRKKSAARIALVAGLFVVYGNSALGQQGEIVLEFAPAKTTVNFTLDADFHTVHGAFNLKHGQVRYNPASGSARGEIVVDATSGRSGNNARDSRMHREILESARYPEIAFRPDRVEGKVEPTGSSSVQVHGTFQVHGASHEVTIPAQVELAADHWTATLHFEIPYVKWGIKNPSNFFLHVSQSVAIDVHADGMNPWGENAPK